MIYFLLPACRRAENEAFNLKFTQPSWPCMPQNGVAGPVNSPRLVLTRKMRIGAAEECARISHMVTHKSVKPPVKLAILLSNERSCVVCCRHFEEENCTERLTLVTNLTFLPPTPTCCSWACQNTFSHSLSLSPAGTVKIPQFSLLRRRKEGGASSNNATTIAT